MNESSPDNLRQFKWFPLVLIVVLITLTLVSRICVAYFLATDAPGDGAVYSQIAKNILEQNVYSLETEAPFEPTLVRLPGYPLFIAAIYSIFGHDNNTAVRVVQAFFETATCVIVALLAFLWTENEEKRRKNAFWAFVLAALCPFIVIYAATLLTETLTCFLMAAMCLTATLGLKSENWKKSLLWWILSGTLAGAAVLLRPDSGLFAAGIGLTLVVRELFFRRENSPKFSRRIFNAGWKGAVFSLCFLLMLAPWTIRNYRVFGVFQPISPAHAEMPGEFVAHGYFRWLRTWVDDSRFTEPMLWNLGDKPISIKNIPANAFDSDEEKNRIAALLEQYNHPPDGENQNGAAKSDDDNSDDNAASDDDQDGDAADDNSDSADDQSAADADNTDDQDQPDDDDDDKKYFVKMTPEIDAAFGQIADERIARSPFHYYFFVPAKRAAALWFDSHSLYYPFGGQISPVSDLDYDENQQYWLPAFAVLMWIYTILGFGGACVLWRRRRDGNSFGWLIFVVLMFAPRLVFLSSIENPEPRYVVELFTFAAILGGIFLGDLKLFGKKELKIVEIKETPTRLLSLDVFRGMTVAAMILVNDPGTWSAIYAPLEHAEWNGETPTDLIFPFFLFIVGVSITFALGKRVAEKSVSRDIYRKIFKRAAVIFALGFLLQIFPFYNLWKAEWFDFSTLRIMGVLPRIAVCYLAASLIFLHTNWKKQIFIVAAILLVYWALMTLINVPGCEITTFNDKTCNLAAYLDRVILTERHIWNQSKVYDPEGILSTLPAIATTLTGVLAGFWLKRQTNENRKTAQMSAAGICLTALGCLWSFWFPLNKTLWTSSFVLYTTGLALCFLSFIYWLIDLKGWRKWAQPFVVFGSNALALYFGSSIMATILSTVELSAPHDKTVTLQEAIFNYCFLPIASPINASLLFAVSFVFLWLLLMWLLYRKRIFIKI